MARHGRSFPIRGVTVNGPKFTVFVGAPAPGLANRLVVSRPAVRGVVPIRPRPTIIDGAAYPFYIGPPPGGVGKSILSRRPFSRVQRLHPQPTINRMVAPDTCRLNFVLTARANLNFLLEVPHATLGRDPLDFLLVECRNEV